MSTYNICLHKEVDKKYTSCNLKTTKSLDCVLIGICAVIRSNTVHVHLTPKGTKAYKLSGASFHLDLNHHLGHATQKRVFGHMPTTKAQISLHIPAVLSGPSQFPNRIIGYYLMYEWRANASMIPNACAG